MAFGWQLAISPAASEARDDYEVIELYFPLFLISLRRALSAHRVALFLSSFVSSFLKIRTCCHHGPSAVFSTCWNSPFPCCHLLLLSLQLWLNSEDRTTCISGRCSTLTRRRSSAPDEAIETPPGDRRCGRAESSSAIRTVLTTCQCFVVFGGRTWKWRQRETLLVFRRVDISNRVESN